jgi:DNA polymerase I-like protein with 3'-5' exonuclease and polymerase domains
MRSFPALPEFVQLEHQVAHILQTQEEHGWFFDEETARELELTLRKELSDITQVLQNRFPYIPGAEFTPKRNNRTQGYVAGATFQRLKDFNPSSREHIAWILEHHDGWKPGVLTSTGKPMMDETILKNHGTGLSLQFLRILELTKILGMMSEGVNAWLKLCTSASRLHHHCSIGCATFRCSHRNPNLAQVPSDLTYRQLFRATPGQVLVGADLSGIELRMLSHYLARYDTYFGDNLLNGDIHQLNADKIGITRKLVKTVTYAFLYGAGNEKIGYSYDRLLSPQKAKAKGREIKDAFIEAIPGLSDLLSAVKSAANRGFVKGIDGRKILVDSPHKALNYLLQGSAGIVAKRWMVIANDNPFCCSQLAFIHDELQYECHPEHADDLKLRLEIAAVEAGEYYNLRIPLAAEGKVGDTWADVH